MWYYGGRIRIEPDWNVKSVESKTKEDKVEIRIEPDWNVKKSVKNAYGLLRAIRIEPDWNVKVEGSMPLLSPNSLE